MSVTLTDTQEMATYVIRTFQLQRVSALNVSIPHHTRMWLFLFFIIPYIFIQSNHFLIVGFLAI
jgi:Ni,Fe-hydrogenase I cytochrome b subunit